MADVIPVHKKGDTDLKTNYRPISILPLLSKILERILYDQLYDYINNYLNDILCGFRKGHSTQNAIFRAILQWQKELDNSGMVGVILMDLSKAYDCLPHDLIIAKLDAYGVSTNSLNLLFSYLNNRKQRTKIGDIFSNWHHISRGVPQGSILGPLLFNIFINDIFLFVEICEICNFADDNTLFYCNKNLNLIKENLRLDLKNLLYWFKINSLKANPEKFKFIVMGKKEKEKEKEILIYEDIYLEEVDEVSLLGITLDNKLTFRKHINNLCQIAHYKIHALRRVRKYLTQEKAKLLNNAFIRSQFDYASVIWMFCSKESYKKLEKLHYKSLKIVYNCDKSYEELLSLSNEFSIHQRLLRSLASEIYKSINGLNANLMKPLFIFKNNKYNLRKGKLLALPCTNTTRLGTNSILFRACMLWNDLPIELKNSDSLRQFKNRIKSIPKLNCNCFLCRM